jgi:molecular chaperone GrpE
MAEKRHIPINGGDGAEAVAAATGQASPRGAQSAPGSAGPATAGAARSAGGRGAHDPHDASTKVIDALTAERDALAAERDALAKERDMAADSLLRLRAEFENFRRRTSREVVDAGVRAQGELLGDLLPVLDNLDRALDAAEHHEEGKVLDGVRLTRNMFAGLLARVGVEEIGEVGTLFDPNLHEAVLVRASEQPEGSVAAVLQRGYRQGERVLRAARVVVSSGPESATSPGGTPVVA